MWKRETMNFCVHEVYCCMKTYMNNFFSSYLSCFTCNPVNLSPMIQRRNFFDNSQYLSPTFRSNSSRVGFNAECGSAKSNLYQLMNNENLNIQSRSMRSCDSLYISLMTIQQLIFTTFKIDRCFAIKFQIKSSHICLCNSCVCQQIKLHHFWYFNFSALNGSAPSSSLILNLCFKKNAINMQVSITAMQI